MMKNSIGILTSILVAAILLMPSFASAESETIPSPFPGAKKGINIWPIEKMEMPMKKEMIRSMKFSAVRGYNETTSTDGKVHFLFQIPKIAAKETRQNDSNPNPLDTHLRSSISKLKLSFNFSGIPGLKKENILGFAPAGGYTHEKGWDGVVEFFSKQSLGVCSFTTYAIEKVIIPQETIEYLVNKKASDKILLGNLKAGFIYRVNWYTSDRRNSLECASKILNHEKMKEIIKIANQIDSVIN